MALKIPRRLFDYTERKIHYMDGRKCIRSVRMPSFIPIIPGWPRVVDDKWQALPIKELLKQRESQVLEFKSSLAWGVNENKPNKHIRKAPPRAIASLMNADGGVLLIGVEDDKQIYGLENDYGLLNGGEAEFKAELLKLCGDCLDTFDPRLLKIKFVKVEGKSVCIVAVRPSANPVFMVWGSERPKLYVRFSNTSQTLTTVQEKAYIKAHFATEV